jgi:acyl carrier protein
MALTNHKHEPPAPEGADLGDQTPFEREIAHLLVGVLDLEIEPGIFSPTDPLDRNGLGLDEIDLLDLAMEVSERYGFQLRSDPARNSQAFVSIRSLAAHVASHRKK